MLRQVFIVLNDKFGEAAAKFEEISNLCLELGDDSLALEFQNKSKKISKILKSLAKN